MLEQVEHVATEEDTFNIEVDELNNFLVGNAGVLVHNSSFSSTSTTPTSIYAVLDSLQNVVYVGKTIQDIDVRFQQHIDTAHPHWTEGYTVKLLESGDWTRYETAVWEQHYIDKFGGLEMLENKVSAISEAKYEIYKYLHDPC